MKKVYGHKNQKEYFSNLLKKPSNYWPQALLFWGPEQVGKKFFATRLAKNMLCQKQSPESACRCLSCQTFDKRLNLNHPDLRLLNFSSLRPRFEDVRGLIKFSQLKPLLGSIKIAIFDEVQNLNRQAANALLKILEDPQGQRVFILITNQPARLLKTILSRTQIISFSFLKHKEMVSFAKNFKVDEQDPRFKLAAGRPGLLRKFITQPHYYQQYSNLLKMFRKFLNDKTSFSWDDLQDFDLISTQERFKILSLVLSQEVLEEKVNLARWQKIAKGFLVCQRGVEGFNVNERLAWDVLLNN